MPGMSALPNRGNSPLGRNFRVVWVGALGPYIGRLKLLNYRGTDILADLAEVIPIIV